MAIGTGVFLLVVGLIFGLNVIDLPASVDDRVATDTLGWILMAAGALAIVISLIVSSQRRQSVVTHEHTREPAEDR